jgi:WD40 repeat protein
VTNVDGFVGPCRVELWDWRSGERRFTGEDGHKAVLNHVIFHPSQPWLIAAGGGDSGGILVFWDLQSQKLLHKAKPKGHIQRFALDLAAPLLLLSGHGGFQIWRFDGKPDEKKSS